VRHDEDKYESREEAKSFVQNSNEKRSRYPEQLNLLLSSLFCSFLDSFGIAFGSEEVRGKLES
jgi:hypothetical protein